MFNHHPQSNPTAKTRSSVKQQEARIWSNRPTQPTTGWTPTITCVNKPAICRPKRPAPSWLSNQVFAWQHPSLNKKRKKNEWNIEWPRRVSIYLTKEVLVGACHRAGSFRARRRPPKLRSAQIDRQGGIDQDLIRRGVIPLGWRTVGSSTSVDFFPQNMKSFKLSNPPETAEVITSPKFN